MLGNILPPYHSLQELNLDWILTKVKDMLRFLPDDGSVGQILRRTAHGAEWSNEQGGGGAVNSVNGQTGDVVLTASDVGALPDSTVIPDSTSDLVNDSGFVDAAGAAAAAPVQSVNGQTGAVTITAPVTSVNGQTGAVSLSIPDSTSDLVNDSGFVNAAGAAAAAPVQSVNGQTGAVVLTIPESNVSGAGYCKMPDGTLICWGSESITRAAGVNTANAVFAQTFYSAPIVTVNYLTGRPDLWYCSAQGTTTSGTTLTMYNSGSSSGTAGTIEYIAVGRWKA